MSSRGTIAVLVAIAVFLYMIRHVLLPFVLAGGAAYVMTPVIDWVAGRTRMPRVLWAAIVFIVFVLLAVILGYFAVPPFLSDMVHMASDLQNILTHALSDMFGRNGTVDFFGQKMTASQAATKAVTMVRNWVTTSSTAFLLMTWGFSAMFGAVLTLVILCYFLIGGRALGAGLFSLVPPHQRPLVDRMWENTDPVLRRYFIGVLVVVSYAICASYIGLGLVLDLKHAGLLAVISGLLEMIPVVGPVTSAVIVGLIALHQANSMWNVIAFGIYLALLRLSIDEFLGPIILGKAASVPAVMVIFCFLAGGILFGIVGVIMSVPVALAIKTVLATLYDEPTPVEEEKAHDSS